MVREKLLQGDPGKINSNVSLEGQVALLPYDPKWEFPRNRLVLGNTVNFKGLIEFYNEKMSRKAAGIRAVSFCR